MEECKTNSIVKGEDGFDYIVLLDDPEKGRIWVRPIKEQKRKKKGKK